MSLRRTKSHLYELRRIRGYGQKHLAHLLGHKHIGMISAYEAGTALPSLKTALLLEIVLGAQLSEIYLELYRHLQMLAVQREAALPRSFGRHIRGRVLGKD
jgi:DNA-binding XRE family transcriptional regulator